MIPKKFKLCTTADSDQNWKADTLHRTQRCSTLTLNLLQIHSFDISSRQIFHMSKERVGILLSLRWKPRNEVLKVRVGP